jgi:hypothetical protein
MALVAGVGPPLQPAAVSSSPVVSASRPLGEKATEVTEAAWPA